MKFVLENDQGKKEEERFVIRMKTISFYDAKPYDKVCFNKLKSQYGFDIVYYDTKLNDKTVKMAEGSDAVCAFVNDTLNKPVIKALIQMKIPVIAMRCAGYNNVDFETAYGKVHVVRVPAYSPYAVAEFALGMLLTLNRKINHAYNRTREFNFSLNGLTGFDLRGKTFGIVGTGKIGRVFMEVCSGLGVNMVAYDPFPLPDSGIHYVSFEELCKVSDVISLHCPLTKESHHIINKESIDLMKHGVYIINTSRGALIDTEALVEALKSGKVGAAGLDVYEEESDIFYEDFSNKIVQDDVLARLLTLPNVLITSHQAYLTNEALGNIAETTLENLKAFFAGEPLPNEVCYHCAKNNSCKKEHKERCF